MKRVVISVWVIAFVAVLAAPFSMSPAAISITANVAYASDPADEGDNSNKGPTTGAGAASPGGPLVTPPDGVDIALPIFGGEKKLSNNKATGGAILVYLKQALQLLSGLIGIVIILMLVIAGMGYITSIGDPSSIKAAKNRVVNAITALVLFLMTFAILNFLVPGGVL